MCYIYTMGNKKELWMGFINLSGCHNLNGPIKLKYRKDKEKYVDSTGEYDCIEEGVIEGDGYYMISSRYKKDIEMWIKGVQAAFKMMKRVTS